MVITEFLKRRFNKGLRSNLFFWRNNTGHEIDLLLDRGDELLTIEIEAGQTITSEFFKGLEFWQKIGRASPGIVVYAGRGKQSRSNGIGILPYTMIDEV